jgi:hypothetical protein
MEALLKWKHSSDENASQMKGLCRFKCHVFINDIPYGTEGAVDGRISSFLVPRNFSRGVQYLIFVLHSMLQRPRNIELMSDNIN